MKRIPEAASRSRFGVLIVGAPYADRSAQPRSSPRMTSRLGCLPRLTLAGRNGRSAAALAGAPSPAVTAPAVPTRPAKPRRVTAVGLGDMEGSFRN